MDKNVLFPLMGILTGFGALTISGCATSNHASSNILVSDSNGAAIKLEVGDKSYYLYTAVKKGSLQSKKGIVSYETAPNTKDVLIRADGAKSFIATNKQINWFLTASFEHAKKEGQPVCDYSLPLGVTKHNFVSLLKKNAQHYVCVKRWYYDSSNRSFYGELVRHSHDFFAGKHAALGKDSAVPTGSFF